MNRTLKALIIGGSICLLGLIVFLVGYYKNDKNLGDIFVFEQEEKSESVEVIYTAKNPASIDFVMVSTKKTPIEIYTHDKNFIQIEYKENDNMTFELTESKNKLILKRNPETFFKEHVLDPLVNLVLKEEDEKIVLHIPSSYTGELLVSTSNGDINISQNMAFKAIKKLDLKNAFGSINIHTLSGNILNIASNRGDITCRDVRFNNTNLIANNSKVSLEYLQSPSLNFIIDNSNLNMQKVMADNIKASVHKSDFVLNISDYRSLFSVNITSSKSIVNLENKFVENSNKVIDMTVSDSTIDISFMDKK